MCSGITRVYAYISIREIGVGGPFASSGIWIIRVRCLLARAIGLQSTCP